MVNPEIPLHPRYDKIKHEVSQRQFLTALTNTMMEGNWQALDSSHAQYSSEEVYIIASASMRKLGFIMIQLMLAEGKSLPPEVAQYFENGQAQTWEFWEKLKGLYFNGNGEATHRILLGFRSSHGKKIPVWGVPSAAGETHHPDATPEEEAFNKGRYGHNLVQTLGNQVSPTTQRQVTTVGLDTLIERQVKGQFKGYLGKPTQKVVGETATETALLRRKYLNKFVRNTTIIDHTHVVGMVSDASHLEEGELPQLSAKAERRTSLRINHKKFPALVEKIDPQAAGGGLMQVDLFSEVGDARLRQRLLTGKVAEMKHYFSESVVQQYQELLLLGEIIGASLPAIIEVWEQLEALNDHSKSQQWVDETPTTEARPIELGEMLEGVEYAVNA